MISRNAIALLLFTSVLKMSSVTSFSATNINSLKVQQSHHQSSPASMLYASAYDQDESFLVEKDSIDSEDGGEVSPDKKELVSQIVLVAVGSFFAYSLLMVGLNAASFVSGAFDIGNIANFAGSVVGTVAGATWTGLKAAAPVVGKGVISAGQAAAPYVQEASQKVSEVATPYVQEAAQKVSEAASPVVEQAAQAVNEAASPYVSAVDSTINSAASAVTSTLDATIVAPIKGATDTVVSTVDSTVKATTDSVVTAVDSSIKEAAGSVSTTLKGVTGGAMESIKQASPF
mmetsp:Transcript_19890/g.48828  ORF Transcript_19890/g.48828 Transcript_19890/m.48828 type:complete len:288 (-) Transcript_19890:220-1083(-)